MVPDDRLTPIQPGSPKLQDPAYQLYLEIDVPVLVAAGIFAIARQIRGGLAPAYCAPAKGDPTAESNFCDRSALNWLDRKAAGRYQPSWNRWSDIGLYGIEALAAAVVFTDEGAKNGLNDLVVIAQATMLASAASGVSTAMTGRPRPYMYGGDAPLSVRQGGNGGLSFFSGHTSTAFGAAVSTWATMRRLHPDKAWTWLVFGGGVAAAGFVGATRILAGNHFPTDVLAGAAVGSSIGILVPALHTAPHRLAVTAMPVPDGGGLALVGRLD